MLILALLSCTTPWSVPPEPVAPTPPHPAVPLARVAPATLELPATTRPDAAEPPTTFAAIEPFERRRTRDGVTVWATALPVDFHLFLQRQAGARTFGYYEPLGLVVARDGVELPFARWGTEAGTWGYDKRHLYVGIPAGEAPPDPAAITLTWSKATAQERTYHLATSGLAPEAFVRRTVQLGTESFTGLMLPAPATAAWTITVPDDGVFATRSRILPPAIRAPEASDGATLTVAIDDAAVHTARVDEGWADVRVDLSAHAGTEVTLTLTTDPGASPTLDLVFLEEPTVYTPVDDPKRIVVAFLDTVRADHLGMYGYDRGTTPKLDRWAASAVRFDDHRTIAPWTLPSARTALTGVQPEQFFETATLADQLAEAGFWTRGIVANAYLSQVFGIHRGFGHYTYEILQPAAATVDQALATFERWPDRDVFVLVQFMEAHLPYREPLDYRPLFAGSQPASLPAVSRAELVKVGPRHPDFAAIDAYVQGRYDNNIRVLDDEVSRLFAGVGSDATTVIFADHGEEFWDHGGFEHGHTFFDELLRVPFVVRSPALRPGVVSAPSSLLDLTPTVVALAGLTPPGPPVLGTSLVPAALGDPDAVAALQARPHGFGRPVYGPDGWGVVAGGAKWFARNGRERVFDLDADPGETTDVAARNDRGAFPAALAAALDREVPRVWRLELLGRRTDAPIRITVSHPDGITAAWSAYDPKGWYEQVTPQIVGDGVEIAIPPGAKAPPAVFLRPTGDPMQTEGLVVRVEGAGMDATHTAGPVLGADNGQARTVLSSPGPFRLGVDLDWSPVPSGEAVSGYDAELEGALRALGYVEEAPE